MNKKSASMRRVAIFCGVFFLLCCVFGSSALCADAVSVILKNASSSSVDVELIDQYGGNFTATIDAGMSQNHTLKVGSDVMVGGSSVHVVAAGDDGKEIVVAQ